MAIAACIRGIHRGGPAVLAVAILLIAACANGGGATPAPTAPPGATATPSPPATPTASPHDGTPPGSGSPTATATAPSTPTSGTTPSGDAGCLQDEPPLPPDQRTAPALSDVIFASDDAGWAVGEGRILATIDGGERWEEQYRGAAQLHAVTFVDGEHGWALADDRLLATSDGGKCWRDLEMPDPPLQSLQFHSPTDGWGTALTRPGPPSGARLMHTSDGGQSWGMIDAPAPPFDVCFTDAENGWLLTVDGAVWRSEDGGVNWTEEFSAPEPVGGGRLQCAPEGAVWLELQLGAATGHVAYDLYRGSAADGFDLVVCNTFFPDCPEPVAARLPELGSYPGPLSSLSADAAVFFTFTPPLAEPSVAFVLVRDEGATVEGPSTVVPELSEVTRAAFRSADLGWALGRTFDNAWRIVQTTDRGQSWEVQFEVAGE